MERATAPQMRKSMEIAEVFKKWGVRFVPMPAVDDAAFESLCKEMGRQLESLAEQLSTVDPTRP